jgi:hypothetical protein
MVRRAWALLDEELAVNSCGNAKEWLFFLMESYHKRFFFGPRSH